MKYTWTADDIKPGRIVCSSKLPKPGDNFGWFAKWTYKIGWLAGGNPKKDYVIPKGLNSKEREEFLYKNRAEYCLISMTDGMISNPMTKEKMAKALNKDNMMPCPHYQLIETINYLKDCYE